jgi:hypothetical protein
MAMTKAQCRAAGGIWTNGHCEMLMNVKITLNRGNPCDFVDKDIRKRLPIAARQALLRNAIKRTR